MKYKIHFDCGVPELYDNIIIIGDTIEEIQEKTELETTKRGWDKRCCWSEEIK